MRSAILRFSCAVSVFVLVLARASLAQLSGSLSGTLGPGTYHVVDTIFINASDTLRLLPSTVFVFDGGFPFEVHGILLAEGTEGDSVVFTADTSVNPNWWRGIRFLDSTSSGSSLAHCIIEFGWATGDTMPYGGGVYCERSSPQFSDCAIRRNWAWFQDDLHRTYGKGGGVYCYDAAPAFVHCTISRNCAIPGGGGVHCENASPTFVDCTFYLNRGNNGGGVACWESAPTFIDCDFLYNTIDYVDLPGFTGHGGGVACYASSPTFDNCVLRGNFGAWGGGLYFTDYTLAVVTNCVIDSNRSEGAYCENGASPTFIGSFVCRNQGVGISCENYASPTFENCIISDNAGGIVCWSYCSPLFSRCSIINNSGPDGGAVSCRDNSSPRFSNCTLSGNSAWGDGGGVFCRQNSAPVFEGCTISDNSTSYSGGALNCGNSSPRFTDCKIEGNSAS
ncbi:MAG: right-handed parallel beta-helix repeat-containing protein, partial [bacterium]